ncbi:unnamed protein product [Closterium sp. NIES-54]
MVVTIASWRAAVLTKFVENGGSGGVDSRGASLGVAYSRGAESGGARGAGLRFERSSGGGDVGAPAGDSGGGHQRQPTVGDGAGGAGVGGAGAGGTGAGASCSGGIGAHQQESLSPQQLRKWTIGWGSSGGGAGGAGGTSAGGAGAGGARGTAAAGSGGAGAGGAGGAGGAVPGGIGA